MSNTGMATSGSSRFGARGDSRDLSVREAAWVLGEPVGTVRRMCEQGFLRAWRVVDPSGSSARLRWHIPSDAVMPLLRTEHGRRRLSELMAGEDSAPPRSRRESPPNQAAIPAPIALVSTGQSSDNSYI